MSQSGRCAALCECRSALIEYRDLRHYRTLSFSPGLANWHCDGEGTTLRSLHCNKNPTGPGETDPKAIIIFSMARPISDFPSLSFGFVVLAFSLAPCSSGAIRSGKLSLADRNR